MLVGRLVREVELKETANNGYVLNNVLAIQRMYRGPSGEEYTDFIPIVVWNSQAQLMNKYCQKGHMIAVYGRMQSRNYKNKDDQTVYVIECIVNEVQLLPNTLKQNTDQDLSQTEQLTDKDREAVDELIDSLKKENE